MIGQVSKIDRESESSVNEPAPPGQTSAATPRSRRLGIGGKLLFAFGSIAALTVVATAIAWILFDNVRENLAIIADDSLPEIATSFRIAEQSAQISAAIPRLTGAQDVSSLTEIKKALDARLAMISSLSSIHRTHETDAESQVTDLEEIVHTFRNRINELEAAVRHSLSEQKKRELLLDGLSSEHFHFSEVVDPMITSAREDMLASTRRSVAEGTARIAGLIDVSFESLRGIMQIEANINLITADLHQVATTNDMRLLRDKRFAIVGPIADIKSQFSQVMEFDNGQQLVDSVNGILDFAIGKRSIFELRKAIIAAGPQESGPLEERLAAAITGLNRIHAEFLKLSRKIIDVVDTRTLETAANATKEGQKIVSETEAGVQQLETLLLINSYTNEMYGLLGEGGAANYREDIEGLRLRYDLLRKRVLNQLRVYESSKFDPAVRGSVEAILAYGQSDRSILSSRLSQLEAMEKASTILDQSQNLATRLSASAQGLVEAAEKAGSVAKDRTTAALATGESVLVGIAVLSLITALLIAWLYVYRQIVRRLTSLSTSMLSIAKGDLSTEIVFRQGNDEITDMRRALVVFRDDAYKRRQAEEALRESERRMRLILATSPIGVGISRRDDGELLYVNERLAEQFGGTAAQLLGSRVTELYSDPEDRRRLLERVENDGFVRDAEVLLKRTDGREFWTLLSFFPIEYAGEAAALGWIYDIAERKRAEEELRDAKERAENALAELKAAQQRLVQTEKMASLGQLTAGVAHEIKNPLNFVKNFAEISVELLEELKLELQTSLGTLEENPCEEAMEQFAAVEDLLVKIKEHGDRANSIVQSMLSHSREGAASLQPTDLNALLEESMDLAYHAARAEDKRFNVTLQRDLDDKIGLLDLYPAELMRVFLNLIGNAFYATRQRAERAVDAGYKPTVTIRTRQTKDSVEVRVRDNGTGVPQSVKDKIFNPFFTTKPPGEGTGLGLSLSYETIVKQHGGWMEVSSEEGSYTEFLVSLPR